MGNKIDFSIIFLCFNSEKTIEKSLLSALNQKNDNIEIIILDGKSSDGTIKIIEKYRDRIDHFISESDGGPVNAINKGWQLARGDYIIILSSDDQLEERYFINLNKILESDPDVISTSLFITRDGNVSKIYRDNDLIFKYPYILRASLSNSRVIKRSIYGNLGGYDEKYYFCADLDFLLKVSKIENLKCIQLNESVYNFLAHNESRTSGAKNLKKIYFEELNIFYKNITKYGLDVNIIYCFLRTLFNIGIFYLKNNKL